MKKACLILSFLFTSLCIYAQFPYGTTGLLHMPTADMQRDKTFMAGAGFLKQGTTPAHWTYDTYNYYVNITFLPCLEVAYACTLHKGVPGNFWPKQTWGKFVNQDRQFSVRLRLLKEGQFVKYIPAVVVGANDALTKMWEGGALSSKNETENGYWNRYYFALTKHVTWQRIGNLGIHAAYVYNKRMDYHLNGPAFGANFQLSLPSGSFLRKALNGVNLMAEYDSRTVNMGLGYSIWKDHINLIGELNDFKHLSAGIYFKVHLK